MLDLKYCQTIMANIHICVTNHQCFEAMIATLGEICTRPLVLQILQAKAKTVNFYQYYATTLLEHQMFEICIFYQYLVEQVS